VLLSCGLGCCLLGWVGYGFLEINMGFIYFLNQKIYSSAFRCSATANAYAIGIHTLPYKYYPLLPPHTDSKMILVICELIDKLSRSLGGDHDSVDSIVSDILNKVIVGVNKG